MITNNFTARHNGVSKAADEEKMLKTIGVSSMEDVIALAEAGIYGAIIGKAYYTGAIDLREAIRRAAP